MYQLIQTRKIWLLFAFWLSITGHLQSQEYKKPTLELLGAVSTSSRKHFNYNTNERAYFEARVGYRLSPYFETSLSIAYQQRDYIYFALFSQPYREVPIFMKRHYIPVALNGRLYLSEFFFEKLKAWKKKGNWDVYTQIGLFTIKGRDVHDSREGEYASAGAYVPYYMHPYVHAYNRLHLSYLAGLRRNFSKDIGLFIEGGEGLLMNGQLGLSINF
jgi:hypothetical protein